MNTRTENDSNTETPHGTESIACYPPQRIRRNRIPDALRREIERQLDASFIRSDAK